MTYNEALQISSAFLLSSIKRLYGLESYEIQPVNAHDGGRNIVYICQRGDSDDKIIRVTFLDDRNREDLLSEVEFVRYLYEHGCSVSNVIGSHNGELLEEIAYGNHRFYVCAFVKAKGKLLVENGYRYRDGVPIAEYFYNCGKVLGRIHQLSKMYHPVHRRYSFFDKYNGEYIDSLIPDSLAVLKERLTELLKSLSDLDRSGKSFGMVHFDYSDGNYTIDFDSGQITVFDFDNSCFCWYMYDLANVWVHGVGWIQFEQDAGKRKKFMEDYFETVLKGYRAETALENSMLAKLPLFIKVTIMENIIDAFEVMRNNGEKPACDEELSYLVKCMEDDIPFKGFFHEIYSPGAPFQIEERAL